jgi:hypothetical protein
MVRFRGFWLSDGALRSGSCAMRDHKSLLAWQEAHAVVLLLPAIRQVKYSFTNPIFEQLQKAVCRCS